MNKVKRDYVKLNKALGLIYDIKLKTKSNGAYDIDERHKKMIK